MAIPITDCTSLAVPQWLCLRLKSTDASVPCCCVLDGGEIQTASEAASISLCSGSLPGLWCSYPVARCGCQINITFCISPKYVTGVSAAIIVHIDTGIRYLPNQFLVFHNLLNIFQQKRTSTFGEVFGVVEELYGTRYQSGSFSLFNVGSGFHCLRSFSFFLLKFAGCRNFNYYLCLCRSPR